MQDRRCRVCGRVLRVTQGDVGPVCESNASHRHIKTEKLRKLHCRMIARIFGEEVAAKYGQRQNKTTSSDSTQ